MKRMKSKLKINYFPELTSILFGREKPSMVSVNITNLCNQSCIYCEIGESIGGSDNEVLTKDDLFWLIDEMAKEKILRLSINGGEPFMFKDIIKVVHYAWENQIKCNITSNGMLIQKLSTPDLEVLKKCDTQINLSIDSFNNDIQVKTRGNSSALENAINAIEILNKWKIHLIMLSAISRYNYFDLFNSLKIAKKLGIKQVLYQPLIYSSNFPDRQAISNKSGLNISFDKMQELSFQLNEIYEYEKSNKIETNIYRIKPWVESYIKAANGLLDTPFYFDVLKKFYCREAHAVIDVSYHGIVQACGLIEGTKSIKNDKKVGLLNKWNESSFSLKKDLENNVYPIECDACSHKFSRNMFASVLKYPISNRSAFLKIIPLFYKRMHSRVLKKLS